MNISEKKYQIFISSTYTDLIQAREEIIKVILNMYHIPIGMEMFSADNADQWETIQETINNSDYYILIIGNRYGSETNEGIGYTEKEFDYAKATGVPIYAYIRNREIPTTPKEREKDQDKIIKLDLFIEKVKNNSMVEFWDQPSDLGQKVSIALPKAFRKHPRVGWVRGDSAVSAETLNEMAVLSKGYRDLKEENEKLISISKTKPILNIKFNDEDKIQLYLPKQFKNSNLMSKVPITPPDFLNNEEKSFYYQDDAMKYNEWIDKNIDIVSEYNNTVYYYERSRASITQLITKISNDGTLKAKDIYINILFPENILIYNLKEKNNLKDMSYPSNAPKSPIKFAQEAYKRGLQNTGYNFTPYSTDLSFSSISVHDSIKISKNNIKIWIKSLLHTKSFTADDIYIMPIKEGIYTAKVSMICEEFHAPYEYDFPFIVSIKD